jgi:hypothetical protein
MCALDLNGRTRCNRLIQAYGQQHELLMQTSGPFASAEAMGNCDVFKVLYHVLERWPDDSVLMVVEASRQIRMHVESTCCPDFCCFIT